MIDTPTVRSQKPRIAGLVIISVLPFALAFGLACGSANDDAFDASQYEVVGRTQVPSTPTPTPVADPSNDEPATERQVHVLNTDGFHSIEDFDNLQNFKMSKTYNVEGLLGADAAIYGFFGPDPYDRREYEARFYPDHDTALTHGVDFANEATGPDAVIASSVQRWDEGLSQRRTCAANVRGSHHSGRCDLAKYGDYVIAGNLVLLCQGRDSASALDNCKALYATLQ